MSVAKLSVNVDCDYAQTLVFGSIEYTSMAIFCITLSVLIIAYILTHRIATATMRAPRKLNSPFYLLFLHDRILVGAGIFNILLAHLPSSYDRFGDASHLWNQCVRYYYDNLYP
ncbi:unnamed protein product [Nippostrongylus brasiliensis]|uniref:G_PROTEIN_RECEP_F1_2 domain-containing protein n=1 Tax=Nippostrongylus brasiliensis TaxID=27835 RepID=A0A0N4XLA8_NIPBR|nr:unnamed protein product [Nippostrongylus brasiliensis]